jgi:23S rRNA pseudouridine955/2504/2580 synthase
VEGKKRIEGYLSKDEEKNKVIIYPQQKEDTEYICTEYEPLLYTNNSPLLRENSAPNQGNLSRLAKETATASNVEGGVKGSYTLLQVKLITGRSHQIRAHLSSIGHPLLGDYKYGDQKMNHYFKVNYGLTHQLLHSYRMVFPVLEGQLSYLSGKEFTAEVPELFMKIKEDLFVNKK